MNQMKNLKKKAFKRKNAINFHNSQISLSINLMNLVKNFFVRSKLKFLNKLNHHWHLKKNS